MNLLSKNRNPVEIIVGGAIALLAVVLCAPPLQAQAAKQKYPSMAPIDQYLMDRDAEIALAKGGAPVSISKDATILVLRRHGYETAIKGTNGFVCIVERSWTSVIDFPEVWNPKIKASHCLNPPAARSILPVVLKKTDMTLAGDSVNEIIAGMKAAFDKKELPALEPGAMSYMMAKGSYLTDNDDHNGPHLMFFVSLNRSDWGADLPGSPVISSSYWFPADDERALANGLPMLRVFATVVQEWSDGTTALPMKH